MFNEQTITEIKKVWDAYIASNKVTRNTKGDIIDEIDSRRVNSIVKIKEIITAFTSGNSNIAEFKTALDSYNKKHNLWGFTATKGQMFFNLLVRNNESNLDSLTALINLIVVEPIDLVDACGRIDQLENFARLGYENAPDKRRVAHPSSAAYFASYYWQIHNPLKWPIMYSSLVNAFRELHIWSEEPLQSENYRQFYSLNEQIKTVLSEYTGGQIDNWSAEHAFWYYSGARRPGSKFNPGNTYIDVAVPITTPTIVSNEDNPVVRVSNITETLTAFTNFDINDYLIPKVARLRELGKSIEHNNSAKGVDYERIVVEIFNQLDFEVESLGQGTGRNPDAIAKFRQDHTAFIIDAKAYSNGYSLGRDDRAIKEYISYHCPKLQKEGFKKIGFIIVSNSFRSEMEEFINDITWNTEIKRFVLLSSEALLYLLAYKTKDKLSIGTIIDFLVGSGPVISLKQVIAEFEDV
ncbi:MAG: hypothetical protein EOO04_20995 [Chitinophagaceae bacterium]|nr:MAG: hypothetical protein EOO04_20995 [Chitinophagaceae bacterium]